LVATPCAVPFMAPAIGYAFAQDGGVILLIMLSLGFGLALPYLLLAAIPSLHQRIPKPGPWMAHFKELMAFFMFASAIWLLWVLAQQVSIDAVGAFLLTLLLIVFLIWLGKNRSRLTRFICLLIAMAACLSLAPLLTTPDTHVQSQYDALVEPFSQARLDALRAEGKPVFVNATAAWCLSCKVNERVALRDSEVVAALQNNNITYLVADWTNYNDEITLWLEDYDRAGVPLYVYYPPNQASEVVLPALLTPSTVTETLTKDFFHENTY